MSHYKIICLGDVGVGKTALVIQFCAHHFVEEYDPTIEDSYRKRVVIDGEAMLLELLDTAGDDEFGHRKEWIKDSSIFLIVYSITSQQSFKEVKRFVEEAICERDPASLSLTIVGNKCDLENAREVTTQQGQDMATAIGAQFKETSAKTRVNVEEAVYDGVRLFWKVRGVQPQRTKYNRRTCSLL